MMDMGYEFSRIMRRSGFYTYIIQCSPALRHLFHQTKPHRQETLHHGDIGQQMA
ncbi:MAG: hypothetical protein ACLRP3_09445 [Escherichia sp.]